MGEILILALVVYMILPSKNSLYKAFFEKKDNE